MPIPYIPEKFYSLPYTKNITRVRQSRSRRFHNTKSTTAAVAALAEDAEYINEDHVLQFHLELEDEDTTAIELDGASENSKESLTR